MKKAILAMVIGVFTIMRISAFDLWNGLDTDKDLSAVLWEGNTLHHFINGILLIIW